MPGRNRSMMGVRERGTPPRLQKNRAGGSPGPGLVRRFGSVVLVLGGPDLDGLEMTSRALEAVLALHAGLHLRHDPHASRRDGLVALHADAILAIVQPLDGRGEPAHALHEHFAR